ncbi:hypothetical protein GCM10012288_25100 [Malaciobacter pacificus]|uniref:sensor histidine kinase n=1 Tax=Malaciobacter pacificus TaxID=1080223 RepID=UPI00102A71F7|nr:HAMP domain-containing sensor histidine kinase [Malaciobacter pacificus]GGD50055.1 hypothetical protein GCM10012288_25100 [Malaciobacter pacificus]
MLNLGPFHSKQLCIVENKKKLEPMREIIHTNTQKGEKFNFYIKNNKNIEIISFLPIKNLSNKTVAYIVSHSKSDIIKSSLTSTMTIRILSFFISLVIIYLIYRQIKSNIQIKIEKEKLQYKTNEQTILLSLFDQGDSVLFKWNNDDNWSINYVSQSVSRLLGYTQDEFLNGEVHYADCIDKQDLQTVISEVEEGSKSDSKFFQHKPYRLIAKDGKSKWVLDYTVVLRDDNGNTTHYLGYITDITEQKENERLIAEQSKLVAMGEMIGNIAHQWRQPLSVISTASTGLKLQKEYNTLTDEIFIRTCDSINDNAQYLSKTIDDFRNFIKGDRKVVEFKLADTIESFLHLVEGSIKSNDIEIIKDIDENIIINGYPNELVQCFINIFNNSKDAFKNKEDDKLIFISTELKEDKVTIIFKDNAGGIRDDILPKVFEPYFTTKHQSQGTGLGLHMTYNLIVDGMNGTIEAHNINYKYNGKEYSGAEFKIILPLK